MRMNVEQDQSSICSRQIEGCYYLRGLSDAQPKAVGIMSKEGELNLRSNSQKWAYRL